MEKGQATRAQERPTAPTDGQAGASYSRLNAALDGEVICNIGQVTPAEKRVLDRAVRAGKLAKWRGKWFPLAGAPFGLGPDKTCWSTPAVAKRFADMRSAITA